MGASREEEKRKEEIVEMKVRKLRKETNVARRKKEEQLTNQELDSDINPKRRKMDLSSLEEERKKNRNRAGKY